MDNTRELLKLVRDQENLITEYYNMNNKLMKSNRNLYIVNWILLMIIIFVALMVGFYD